MEGLYSVVKAKGSAIRGHTVRLCTDRVSLATTDSVLIAKSKRVSRVRMEVS